ncbi:hypothetical protein [uncultured Gammaproteobacteria bacterium]|nr:hypothetical protein [uncultured Gammaproteobacteria bacterium]CAC9577128.1 hypothetical protein [uncultured Gammaproteobacteria bacterium]CAC9970257.1 hypothetical protein [uncultured Gammaproteobacteria bacterium]
MRRNNDIASNNNKRLITFVAFTRTTTHSREGFVTLPRVRF